MTSVNHAPSSFARRSSLPIVLLAALALALPSCVFAPGRGHDCGDDCPHWSAHHAPGASAHCPVSRESVRKSTAPSATVDGETYFFHCNTCKNLFVADPDAYRGAGAASKGARGGHDR